MPPRRSTGDVLARDRRGFPLRRLVDMRNPPENNITAGFVAYQIPANTYAPLQWMVDEIDNALWMNIQDITEELINQHRDDLIAYFEIRRPYRLRGQAEILKLVKDLSEHVSPSRNNLGLEFGEEAMPAFIHQTNDIMRNPPFHPFGRDDAKVVAMVNWFKNSFMRWVDPIKCPRCRGETESNGSSEPTGQERSHGAGRVELHRCKDVQCGAVRRFPRYNQSGKLYRTREGRCGEWAQLFYALLLYSNIDARYVWNSEDHVWCEYWSSARNHWVHVDPCEAAVNKPLLYERGWGKKQGFCIAVGKHGAEDVTWAYVTDREDCMARRRQRGWDERALRWAIRQYTVKCRLSPFLGHVRNNDEPDERWVRWNVMDQYQALWMADDAKRVAEAQSEELGGRTSGTADWRAARAELGRVTRPSIDVTGSHPQGWQCFGNAIMTEDNILLTTGTNQNSAVFNTTPVSQNQSFRCAVTFRLTAPRGSGEADGIAIVFVPERKLGLSGFGLGYSGLGGIGDFAVEIDTYQTRDHANDPPVPHISVHSPPKAHHHYSISCTNSIPYLSDGNDYTLELLFNATSRMLRGYLHAGEDELGVCEVVIPKGHNNDWYIGVTGSCGGLWQRQEIVKWTIDHVS